MIRIKKKSILALVLSVSIVWLPGCQNKGTEEHSIIAIAQSEKDYKKASQKESSKYATDNTANDTTIEMTTEYVEETTVEPVTTIADTQEVVTEPVTAATQPTVAEQSTAVTKPSVQQDPVTEEEQPQEEATPEPVVQTEPQPGVALTIEQAAAISEANYNNYYGYIMQVAELINQFRAENGLAPVSVDYTDCIVAGIRSAEGAHLDYFSHERPDGSKVSTVINYYGISWERCGENLGRRQTSPEGIVEGWKNSDSGHREIMLKAEWTSMGIGVAVNADGDLYWSAVFIQN